MIFNNNNIDVTTNIKTVDKLKSDLLQSISELFKTLVSGNRQSVTEHVINVIAEIILNSYLLGKRLGISYNLLQMKIDKKIKLGIIKSSSIEKNYGELTSLSKHFERVKTG